jgi:hypothetical protein
MGIPIAFLAGLLVCAIPALADEGCSKDTDCKGERICKEHVCVDPAAARGAAPAGYAPGAPMDPPPTPPAVATAPPARTLDTVHRHFGGFIRPDLGFGYFTTSAEQSGVSVTVNGFAATFGFAAGGAISENNILAVHVWDTVVTSPTASSGGSSAGIDGSVTLWAIGPEYTHYTNDNLYFAISPSLSRMSVSSGGSSADTNFGFGLRAGLGKEWWVSDHWGLGLVGHVSMSFNQDSGSSPPTWTSWAFTCAFSATYN